MTKSDTTPQAPSKSGLQLFVDSIAMQFVAKNECECASIEVTPTELLLKLCSTEQPEADKVERFVELMSNAGFLLKARATGSTVELVYLMEAK